MMILRHLQPYIRFKIRQDIIASGASQSGFRKYAGKGNLNTIPMENCTYSRCLLCIKLRSEFAEYAIEVKQDEHLEEE